MDIKFETHMLMKFLTRNFPVSRIKHNGRFRRAIVFDDGTIYLYSDQKQMIALKYKLMGVLKDTFLANDSICLAVLDSFLQLDELEQSL